MTTLAAHKISVFYLVSVAVQPGSCLALLETPESGFLTSRLIMMD